MKKRPWTGHHTATLGRSLVRVEEFVAPVFGACGDALSASVGQFIAPAPWVKYNAPASARFFVLVAEYKLQRLLVVLLLHLW